MKRPCPLRASSVKSAAAGGGNCGPVTCPSADRGATDPPIRDLLLLKTDCRHLSGIAANSATAALWPMTTRRASAKGIACTVLLARLAVQQLQNRHLRLERFQKRLEVQRILVRLPRR